MKNKLIMHKESNRDTEKVRKNKRRYYLKNREKILAKQKSDYENDKESFKNRHRKYQEKNKDKIRSKKKSYREKNIDKSKDYMREYYKTNKEKIRNRQKENKDRNNENQKVYSKFRRDNDPLYKISGNLRRMISRAFYRNGYTKESRTHEILGCQFSFFKIYLESKFEQWMNWDNYGVYNGELTFGWDIDHIIPLSSAITEEDIIKLNYYTNLQPLCSKVNRDIKKDNLIIS